MYGMDLQETSSPVKKRKKTPHHIHPFLKDSIKSSVSSAVDERSEEAPTMFEGKDLLLIQLPKHVREGWLLQGFIEMPQGRLQSELGSSYASSVDITPKCNM